MFPSPSTEKESPGGEVGDSADLRAVYGLMRIWQGTTPDGYAVLVERDGRGWVVTVATVSRSRNGSLSEALVEAGGGSVPRDWAEHLEQAIHGRLTQIVRKHEAQSSQTGAA